MQIAKVKADSSYRHIDILSTVAILLELGSSFSVSFNFGARIQRVLDWNINAAWSTTQAAWGRTNIFHRHSRWLYIQQQSSSSASSNRFIEQNVSTRQLGPSSKRRV